MATEAQITHCLEIQRIAMQISIQGNYQFHTNYWGHTDEFGCWGNSTGKAGDISGWQSSDHKVYLGLNEDGVEVAGPIIELIKLRDDLSAFLSTDEDGVPL